MGTTMLLWMAAALLVLLIGGRLVRVALALVLGPAIGRTALAQQPDTIHLAPLPPDAWRDAATVECTTALLVARGFTPAGDHAIPELPGVHVRLLAHEPAAFLAAIYEHPIAGQWFDLVHRGEDGSSATWTTAPPTGLDDRPGHPTTRVPGAHPGELFDRARREAGHAPARPAEVRWAGRDFEEAYAESIAWRKARGVSRREVVQAASHSRRAA